MTIQYLDFDPQDAARYHSDFQVIQMIPKYARLLEAAWLDKKIKTKPHQWVQASSLHYYWLAITTAQLCVEYFYLRGEHHPLKDRAFELMKAAPSDLEIRPFEEPVFGLPILAKRQSNPIECHRFYYRTFKLMPTWKRPCGVPYWFKK